MITINISEEAYTKDQMADILDRISELLRRGNNSGYGPEWEITGEEEQDPEEEA